MKKRKIIAKLSILLSIFMGISSYTVKADEVVSSPKIELSVKANDTDNSISLNWSMGENNDKYSYMLYSKDSKEEVFQSIPAKATAKVLNVYPNVGNNLKTWMETNGYGKGLISVDEVSINNFNNNPNGYLKDSNGNWKYDVIMFGSWDGSNGVYPSNNAVELFKQFIDSGRGFLAGHDTIGYIWGTDKGLGRIRDKFNIKVGSWNNEASATDIGYENLHGGFESTKTILKKKGLLTNYPWELGEVGTVFTVPKSHSTSNFAYGDIWMIYPDNSIISGSNIPSSLYKNSNYYLTTWNNTAMIQTGHSNGQATPDEQKIIANTLFYLSQVTEETSWTDHKGQDLTAPKKPENLKVLRGEDGKIDISYDKSEDLGNTYEYYVEATERNTGSKIKSDTKNVTLTSGLKGYSISIDQNPNGIPDGKITTKDNKYSINNQYDSVFYVHVAAVDNAGNVSEVTTYKSDYPKLDLTVSNTEKTQDSVKITAKAISSEIGIKEIILPNGETVESDNFEYTVTENGVYTFIAVDKEGYETKQSVTINNILSSKILNIQLQKDDVNNNEEFFAYLTIDNVDHIKSEEATIKYDETKLQLLGMQCENGVRFIKSSKKVGEVKVILSSKGDSNIATGYKKLLKLKFKAKSTGSTLIYVQGGKISDGIKMERDLSKDECGSKLLNIGVKNALKNINLGTATVSDYKAIGVTVINSTNLSYVNEQFKNKNIKDITNINDTILDLLLAKNLNNPKVDKYEYKGHKYAIINEAQPSWSVSKQKCEALGGHLVTITTAEEQKFIEDIVLPHAALSYFSIGIYKSGNEWLTITGEKLNYFNWSVGEPNNQGNIEDKGEIYSTKVWNDIPDNSDISTRPTGFIIEWE